MGTLIKHQVKLAIKESIEDRIDKMDIDNIKVKIESSISGIGLTASNYGSISTLRRPDIVVYKHRDYDLPELDSIETISRWFPEKGIDIPIVEIELKENVSTISTGKQLPSYSPESDLLVCDIKIQTLLDEPQMKKTENHLEAKITDIEDIDKIELVKSIIKYINKKRASKVVSEERLQQQISDFDPNVFHFNQVLSSYKNGDHKLLVILLSVFFEKYIDDLVEKTMEERRGNNHSGSFYKKWGFKEGLDACRFFGVLSENEYRIIDEIRDERNNYAHDIEKFHADINSQVVEDGTLEEAIYLYEEIIGVKDSIINNK